MATPSALRSKLAFALLAFTLLGLPLVTYAGPKTPACKPDICKTRKEQPKAMRKILKDLDLNAIDLAKALKTTPARITVFPPTEDPITAFSFTVPANRTLTQRCFFGLSGLQCTTVSEVADCPRSINIHEETSGIYYTCDLDCTPNRPDSQGNCQCDIDYGSCKPF